MTDPSIQHLLNIIDGGKEQRQKADAAVNRLLSLSDPTYREPEHRDDAGVMQLVELTNRELTRQQGR